MFVCADLLFPQRLEVFQSKVMEDRSKVGIPTSRSERHASAYIDIHRRRILEDGYVQLSELNPKAFKGTIRVKFINEQVQYNGYRNSGLPLTKAFDLGAIKLGLITEVDLKYVVDLS